MDLAASKKQRETKISQTTQNRPRRQSNIKRPKRKSNISRKTKERCERTKAKDQEQRVTSKTRTEHNQRRNARTSEGYQSIYS